MLDAGTIISFLGVALSFLSACTFLAPFFYFLLFSFSLSLFSLLYRWFDLLVQVKQIGGVLQSFYYNRGGEGMYKQGEGRGLSKYG